MPPPPTASTSNATTRMAVIALRGRRVAMGYGAPDGGSSGGGSGAPLNPPGFGVGLASGGGGGGGMGAGAGAASQSGTADWRTRICHPAPGSKSGCPGPCPSSAMEHDANRGLEPPIRDIQIVAASCRGGRRQPGGGAGGAAVAGGGATGALGENEAGGGCRSAAAAGKNANGCECVI